MTHPLNLGRISGLASQLMAALPILTLAMIALSAGFVAA